VELTQKCAKLRARSTASGAVMEDGTYVNALQCECSNKGVAIYSGTGTQRRLHELGGDFHRGGESDDPPVICDFCGLPVKA